MKEWSKKEGNIWKRRSKSRIKIRNKEKWTNKRIKETEKEATVKQRNKPTQEREGARNGWKAKRNERKQDKKNK